MAKSYRAAELQIAERIMGWRWLTGYHNDVISGQGEQQWLLPPDMSISDVPNGEWTDYADTDDGRYTLFDVPRYSSDMSAAWQIVDRVLQEDGPWSDYKMSFGMEYSSVVDWVVEFVPRRNHPHAREYNGVWQAQDGSAPYAICLAAMKFIETLSR